jgi:uncharacterized delta-60 repeat protein/CSLREA domain-containing protein
VVTALVAIPARVTLADPGDLDTTFGTGGMVTTDFAGGSDIGRALAIQPDGKIVVAGHAQAGGEGDFALTRYNVDGSPDTTFDGDGKVLTDFGSGDEGRAVAIQPDGKIVVAGSARLDTTNRGLAVARYDSNGNLDNTFGSGGKVTTDFGGNLDGGYAVTIQPDDKIVVAGSAIVSETNDFALARYNSDGSLDNSFGTGGMVTTDFDGGHDYGRAITIQPDGKIVVVGNTSVDGDDDFALARYNVDGSLDNTLDGDTDMPGYPGDGMVTTDFAGEWGDIGYAVTIQPDGKIVVAGQASSDFGLARYDGDDGKLDDTFGTSGKVTTDFDSGNDRSYAIALQPDGKMVAAGYASISGGNDFALACYDSNGNLDGTFGSSGKVHTDFDSERDWGHAVALQGNKIIVAGFAVISGTTRFAVARYDYDTPPGTFIVNTTVDEKDDDCSDGDCSLRDAILLANNEAGPNTINFLIPGDWVHTIQPNSPPHSLTALPVLSGGGTTIDGYSQPGAMQATDTTSATLRVEIDGSLVLNNSGFNINSADNVIQGLVINRFGWNGIAIGVSTAIDNTIRGNYIGTDASGTTALGNVYNGVYIALGAENNTVGGDEPADRNVISGNGWSGVDIQGANTKNTTVSGNYIGTGADGVSTLGNTRDGVHIRGGTHGNIIGGEGPGQGNLIAHNSRSGVRVQESTTIGNAIQRNRILANAELGIDLLDDTHGGILPPQILATSSGSVEVLGIACPGCTVEVFENGNTDGEGERYVGSAAASESGAFTLTVSSLSELYLTATATDAVSGTSEFSAVFTATVPIYDYEVFLPLVIRDFP